MPVIRGSNKQGSYYKWGKSGKKYFYIPNNKKSRIAAKQKARKQGIAIIIQRNKAQYLN